MSLYRLAWVVVVAAGLSLAARPAAAQTSAPDSVAPEAVAAIARDLNCPLCQGYSLQDCPLTVCAQMRDLIRDKLAAGATRQEIVTQFVNDYGPQVLNEPPVQGAYLAAWVLPALVLLAGLAAVVLLLRRDRTRPDARSGALAPAAPDAATAERIEALMRRDELEP